MQLKLKTSQFQGLVTKSIKGASNNKMIPVTSFLGIELKANTLYLKTTDGTNYLTVICEKVEGQDFSVTVMEELFSKLVAKTTSDYITLDYNGSELKFIGNGTYNLEIPLDEEGAPVAFPTYNFNTELPKKTIQTTTVKNIIQFNKPALATTLELPAIINYYCSDKVVSADIFNICVNKTNLWSDQARLISPTIMELLALNTSENITVQFADDGSALFSTPEMVLYGKVAEGVEEYPIDAAMQFVDTQFPSVCKLPKSALLNVLDRLSLFISDFETNGVFLTFTTDGLEITSNTNAKELIKYAASERFAPYTCYANVPSLVAQINSHVSETIELHYGQGDVLKLTDGNITQVVALMEDPRTSGNEEVSEEDFAEGEEIGEVDSTEPPFEV